MRKRTCLSCLVGCVLLASPGHGSEVPPGIGPEPGAPHTVVLLHGLAQGPLSMRFIQADLERAGYRVHNLDYGSTEATVEELADDLYERIQRELGNTPVHFVTHSLGGIVLRSMLARHPDPAIAGRIVMLGPPNQGSPIADRLRHRPLLGWLMGPAALQLGTSRDGIAARLPAVPVETGVIAGRCSVNPLFSPLIPGPDDGAVAVADARVPGMRDLLVLCSPHTLMLHDRRARAAILQFLTRGRFADDPKDAPGTSR